MEQTPKQFIKSQMDSYKEPHERLWVFRDTVGDLLDFQELAIKKLTGRIQELEDHLVKIGHPLERGDDWLGGI